MVEYRVAGVERVLAVGDDEIGILVTISLSISFSLSLTIETTAGFVVDLFFASTLGPLSSPLICSKNSKNLISGAIHVTMKESLAWDSLWKYIFFHQTFRRRHFGLPGFFCTHSNRPFNWWEMHFNTIYHCSMGKIFVFLFHGTKQWNE